MPVSSSSSQDSSDPWDQPAASVRLLVNPNVCFLKYSQQTSSRPRVPVKAAPIPDDWEDDDDDDEEPQNEEDNRRIWEDA